MPGVLDLSTTIDPHDAVAAPGYTLRVLTPRDAAGVVACVQSIYGDTYVHPELYDAAEIERLNQSGQLVSVVALTDSGNVVGHYGLERPDLSAVAETGEALVLPEHRHKHLMEAMRALVEDAAQRLRLAGIFGHAVTNHVFSQRAEERFGDTPCAISLGWSPLSFRNLNEPLRQRMSDVLYFKYLRSPEPAVVHLPPRHKDWCGRIYERLGTQVSTAENRDIPADGKLTVEVKPKLQRARVQVRQAGANSRAQLATLASQLPTQGIEAIFLELPLSQPGTPELCAAAEELGFFFSGLGPDFAADGDALRMQWLGTPIDPSLIQVQCEFSRALLDYVTSERTRTHRAAAAN